MKVQFEPELTERKPLAEIARAATTVLEQAIGPRRAAYVTVTWGLRKEGDRPKICLTLADWSEEVSAEFAPEELQPPDEAKWRFRRLWWDLLQSASDRVERRLDAIMAEGEDS